VNDRICLITGTASGMGRIAAKALARKGDRLVLVDFDVENGEAAREEIVRDTGNSQVDFIDCDISSFSQVRRLAEYVNDEYPRLDVLINNAGVTESIRRESDDGFEITMATNFLGPFLLTHLLLDKLKGSAPSRIINISSDAHKMLPTLDFDDIDNRRGWEKVNHGKGFQAYARSKLCLLCFSYELAERLAGNEVAVHAVSPGYFIRTNVTRHMRGIWKVGVTLVRPFMQSPYRAARTYIYLAAAPEVRQQTGGYWEHCKPKQSSKASYDRELRQRVWDYAATATGLAKS